MGVKEVVELEGVVADVEVEFRSEEVLEDGVLDPDVDLVRR